MEHQQTEEDLKRIARQLACPDGEHGIKTGEVMNISNAGMTKAAIYALCLKDEDSVLEIGHGNGAHIANLLKHARGLKYFGADISATMIAQAEHINAELIQQKSVSFSLTDGETLPFETQSLDKVFTVNTIYFWKNPSQYLAKIKRILKPNGSLVIAFADKIFMQKLPFTRYGFNLFEKEAVLDLLKSAGFLEINFQQNEEQIQSNAGNLVDRTYHVASAKT